jgi:hypothetical protein
MTFRELTQERPASATFGFFSIRTHLLLLIAAILLPMLAQVGVLAWYYGVSRQQAIDTRRLDLAEDLMDSVDREVQMRFGFLSGIGVSPAFQSGQEDIVQKIAHLAVERGYEGLALFDADGKVKFATAANLEPLFTHPDELGFAEIAAGRRFFVSNLLALEGRQLSHFLVTVPIMADGKIAYYVSGALAASTLQGLFAESHLPDSWTAAVIDRRGIMVARSQRPEAYVGTLAQEPMVRAAMSDRRSGVFDSQSREDIAIKNTFVRTPPTGWLVAVAVPSAIVNAPLWESVLSMLALAFGLTLTALFLAVLVANRITRAVHQLGRAAVAFAAGDVIPVEVSSTAHVEDVSQALEAATSTAHLREASRRR